MLNSDSRKVVSQNLCVILRISRKAWCKTDPLLGNQKSGYRVLSLAVHRWMASHFELQFCDESLRLTYSFWLPRARTIRIFMYLCYRCQNFGNFFTKGNGRCCFIPEAYGKCIVLTLCLTRLLQVDNVIQMAWIPRYLYEVSCYVSGSEMTTL